MHDFSKSLGSGKRIFMTFLLLMFLGCRITLLSAQTTVRAGTAVPDHPRLLLLDKEVPELRDLIGKDPRLKAVSEAIINKSNAYLSAPPFVYKKEGIRLLAVSSEALKRIFFMAFSYRLTGDKKYAEAVEQDLLEVCAFKDWNPSHFLDVAEMTMAVAIGYDWIYPELSPASLKTIRKAILEKGLMPSFNDKYNSWLQRTNNWNQVCNAGLTYGAIAIYESEEKISREVINRSVKTISLPMKEYEPDGAYQEGYSYWGYGTSFNTMYLSALEKAFKTDFGIVESSPGYMKTASYYLHMVGPDKEAFNYSDASSRNGQLMPAVFWFAGKLKDPSLLWNQQQLFEKNKDIFSDRLLPALLVWCMNIKKIQAKPPKDNFWVGAGINPVALMRTSWNKPEAIFLGFKAGTPGASHGHMDVGSFVMDADGVRWASDLGMQSYFSLEQAGIKLFGKDRWAIFRYTNKAHNTLIFNDTLQNAKGIAKINQFSDHPDDMSVRSDLSDLDKTQVKKHIRSASIVDKAYVLIEDSIEANVKPVDIRWNMITEATASIINNHTIKLMRDGKELFLIVKSTQPYTLKLWQTVPPNKYDALNPGTIFVGFTSNLSAHGNGLFKVYLGPKSALPLIED